MHQALYGRNWYVDSTSPSEVWLTWHPKGFIFKEPTRGTCPVLRVPSRNVGMEVIVAGTEPLGSRAVIREKASFY